MRLLIALASAVVVVGCRSPAPPPETSKFNVLLVTVDTLRADRLGRGLTPALDRLAARGLNFTNARTVAPLTLPAHVSMMTGQLPPAHGVRLNGAPLGDSHQTLAARLQRAGYRTGAVVGAFVLDRRFGLARGFDDYDDDIQRDPAAVDRLSAERKADVVVDRAMAWLDRGDPRPWFLWLHVYDPHAPYHAPGTAEVQMDSVSAYEREVAYVDAQLARLLAHLDGRSDQSRTVVIVSGDHGESLGEHGEATHGMVLFEPAVRVPLIISAPQVAAARRDDPVSVVDITPTILAMTGQPAETSLTGRNIAASADPEREIYLETEYPPAAGWSAAGALVQGRFKLIAGARPRLFDLANDPREGTDLSGHHPQIVAGMRARVSTLKEVTPGTTTAQVDPHVAARLRALGYVSASTSPAAASVLPDASDYIHQWSMFESALAAEARGELGEATSQLRTLAEQSPESPLFQSTFARLLSARGQHRQALILYRSIVGRWPRDAALFHELAVAARAAGDHDEAVRAEQAALTLAPDSPSAHNGLGLALADRGRHEDAARAFAEATKHDPNNASYVANLGNALRALGRLEEAASAYRRALAREPGLPDAANGLGVVLVQQKRPADAIPFFERAIASDRRFIEPQLNLGIALEESGQRALAIAQYRRVEAAAAPDSREHQAARTLRQQLEQR